VIPTLVTTAGAANANAYVDIAGAATYHATHPHGTSWFAEAALPRQAHALILATRLLDLHCRWKGSRASVTQALGWPRSGVEYHDTRTGVWEYGWIGTGGIPIPPTIIPTWLQDATAEFARELLDADRTDSLSTASIQSLRIGPISLDLRHQGGAEHVLPSSVQVLVSPYVASGGMVKRLVRT
jgi:hypothetical protein